MYKYSSPKCLSISVQSATSSSLTFNVVCPECRSNVVAYLFQQRPSFRSSTNKVNHVVRWLPCGWRRLLDRFAQQHVTLLVHLRTYSFNTSWWVWQYNQCAHEIRQHFKFRTVIASDRRSTPKVSKQCSKGPSPLSSGSAPDLHYRLALRTRHKAPWKLSNNSTTVSKK